MAAGSGVFFSLVLVTDFSSVAFSLKCQNTGFSTDWLRSKSAKSSCIRLPVTVHISKMPVLKFPIVEYLTMLVNLHYGIFDNTNLHG